MIPKNPSPEGNGERSIEPALYAAASYEPESAMPPGLETRALSRLRNRGTLPSPGRLALAGGSIILAAILVRFATAGFSYSQSSAIAHPPINSTGRAISALVSEGHGAAGLTAKEFIPSPPGGRTPMIAA